MQNTSYIKNQNIFGIKIHCTPLKRNL